MLHRSLATAAVLALAVASSAQVASFYSFSQSAGTYAPITGGTLLGTASTANTLDDVTFTVNSSFPVNYDLNSYSTFQVQTNGHIAFGATLPGTTYTPMSSTAAVPGFVSAFGRDLQGGYTFASTSVTGTNTLTNVSANGPLQVGDVIVRTGVPAGTTITAISGTTITMSANATASSTGLTTTCYGPWSELRWEEVGTAPNREIVFQWSNFRRFGTGLTVNNGTFLNFQIRLHENGEIRCVYGNCSPGVTGVTTTVIHQVGLRGPTNTFATNVNAIQSVKGTSDWGTPIAATANTQGHPFNAVAPANVISNGLTYLWTPQTGTVASNTTLGTGCGAAFNSAYQLFADAALASAALQGNSLQLINTGAGYVGTWLPGTAASLFVTPVAATVLAVGDDGEVNVAPSVPLPTPYGAQATLRVTGNGVIGFGNVAQTFPGTGSFTPTAAGFLNSNQGGFYAWHDYNSAEVGSGPVASEEIGGVLYITYNGVENYSTPVAVNTSTLQFQLNLSTGDCTICWVTVDNNTTSTFGSGHLIGVTGPGTSGDPGSTSLAAGFLTVAEVPALTLAATSRPQQLPLAANNWNLNADNLPVGIGVDIIGLADPGITNLALFGLGQANCQLRATLDITGAFLSGGAHPWSFPIPAGAPALNGVELFAQTAVLDFAINLANTLTTNGIKGTIGNL
ncbi:MAG: hypothetical protein ACK501_08615 [Planctomycetota bacterium]|jgi:hypothetical protein